MIKNSVLETMNDYGGKFVGKLADLYAIADSKNKEKLESAFSEIFKKYKKMDDELSRMCLCECEECDNGECDKEKDCCHW
ncbi:MAG: hypothetical protein PHQ03_10900 [Methylococcales bacterium]|nr:hypothetical protein [Methylococcales bacterium]